jgi:glycosyltransferase involved in cell wall biosynthesis
MTELATGFKERGHHVEFLIYHDIPFFKHKLDKAGISITCIDESSFVKRLIKMRRIIRNGRFDAVLSFLEAPNFISELAGLPNRKWKMIAGERNADPGIIKSLKLKGYRWLHIFTDSVVSNSMKNIEYVLKVNPLLPRSKCKVIYNIIDFNYWCPREGFIFKRNNKLKLVISARHQYQKNLNGLVDALLLMNSEDLEKLSIHWYGDSITPPYSDNSFPESMDKIKKNKLERIISFYPAKNDLVRIVQDADTIGLFSHFEGFPNSICEGMACGKPVISSCVSDIPEFLSYDRNLLFDPENAGSIKHSLLHMIHADSSYLNEIGNLNLKIVKENFMRERIISSYLEVLN